ncbi:MAG: peptidase M20, partial [Steroidobacteraceae bacterium]
MRRTRRVVRLTRADISDILFLALGAQTAWCATPQSDAAVRATAHDIFKQLIEINTTDSIGSTT